MKKMKIRKIINYKKVVSPIPKEKYDYICDFNEYGVTIVKLNNKYGLINTNGEEIVSCKYDKIHSFNEHGIAKVKLNNKYGLINTNGEEIVPCKYDYIYNFNGYGIAEVELNNKWGVINTNGEEIISCKYDLIYDFNEYGLAIIKLDNKYGLINIKGEEFPPICDDPIDYKFEAEFTKVKIKDKEFYLDENFQLLLIEDKEIDIDSQEYADKPLNFIEVEDYGYMTITEDGVLIEQEEEKKLTKTPQKPKHPTN